VGMKLGEMGRGGHYFGVVGRVEKNGGEGNL